MRQAALRTLLVVSERPHPWAFLRDRLDPALVSVAWARPGGGRLDAAPWMVAGDTSAPLAGATSLRDHLVRWLWVGPAPAGLPAAPSLCPDWHEVAAEAELALAARLAGLRLAPGRGLVLPDGSYLPRAAELETLLGAHPCGIVAGPLTPRLRSALRRAATLLRRHQLPLRVTNDNGRVALVEQR